MSLKGDSLRLVKMIGILEKICNFTDQGIKVVVVSDHSQR